MWGKWFLNIDLFYSEDNNWRMENIEAAIERMIPTIGAPKLTPQLHQ